MHGVEDAAGAKANHKPSAPSHRKKRQLNEEFVASTNAHLDWDAESIIYQHYLFSHFRAHFDK